MARKLRPRRGTTGQNNAYTGLSAEITIDTTKNTIVVHDGVTVGGHPLTTAAGTTTAISNHVAAADPHTRYITYADAFADVVLSGLVFPTSATLTSTMTSGVAEVIGTRVVVPATANTFTASQDTYVDLSNAGVLTYLPVALNAAAPAVTVNSLRLQKVVTSATGITSVVQLASRELTANRNVSVPAPTLGGHATNKDFVSAELSAHNAAADPHTGYALESTIGVANGIAGLDGTGKVPAAQLPSYVDDVLEYANYAALPATGETGKIYIAQDTGASYRWTGTVYIKLSDDDVLQFANLAAFPASGVGAALYIAADTGLLYRWDGAAYAAVGLHPIASMTMLGNNTGGSAVPTALTKGNVQTLLDIGWVLQSRNVAAPNATVPAHMLTATGAEANIDLVLQAKGYGAVTFTMPDGTATGGNKRGQYAIDLQRYRGAATSVASADYSVAVGQDNSASSSAGVAVGYSNVSSGSAAVAIGNSCNVSGTWAVGVGRGNTVAGGQSVAFGENNNVAAGSCGAFGRTNTVAASAASNSFCFGYNNNAPVSAQSIMVGEQNSGGGFLFGKTNTGAIGTAYAFGLSNTVRSGFFFGQANVQDGNNGVCYAVGNSNTFSTSAQVMSLGRNNVAGDAWDTVVVGNLATVNLVEDFSIIHALRQVTAAKTSHVREVHPGGTTTDATVTPLTIGVGTTYGLDNIQLVLGTVNMITANFVAISSADRKVWKVEAAVFQADSVSAPVIDVQTITEVYKSAGATAWGLTLTAPSNYRLNFNATGVAATTIKWLGKVEITQLQI